MATTAAPPSDTPTSKPYRGSCHCGATRYIAHLQLPPVEINDPIKARGGHSVRIYKCNCSMCVKSGLFHLRMANSPRDFALLAPLDPNTELGDYMCGGKKIHFYFCKNCGVRCFALMGEGEVVQLERTSLGLEGEGKVTVWRPKMEGWVEAQTGYLSVNAATLEQGQHGLDLREWIEKKWVYFLDQKDGVGEANFGGPHEGGTY